MGERGRAPQALTFLLALTFAPSVACEETPPIEQLVDYARDVQPILADRCFG
jgi:hypothetical protein